MAQAFSRRRSDEGFWSGQRLYLREGTVLQNRYRITGALSVQGRSQVYKASDLRFPGSHWAIKAYMKFPGEDFRSAMRLLASFHHPYLVKVVDFFEEEGTYCMVMEYIHGRPLEHILEESPGPLPERQVLSWGVQCADALLYLHESSNEFTHYRNLSPRKILISTIGELKLIPKIPDSSDDTNVPGIMGYAPPEVFDEHKTPDERCDVYTLGAIVHRCLSGGNPAAIPFVFIPLDPVNPNLDSAIERILEKATRANPDKRYSSLDDFRKELYRCLQAVLRIQFHIPGGQGFSDLFWWTLMTISGAAIASWFYLYHAFSKYR